MTRFIAVVSGKGGAGKTTAAINVAYALAQRGRKTILLDASLQTPHVGIYLGRIGRADTSGKKDTSKKIDASAGLNDLLEGRKTLHDVLHHHESGLYFVPASASYAEYLKTDTERFSEIFEHLDEHAEFVVVDSPPGLGREVQQVLQECDEALLIVMPTPGAVVDALKTVQLAKEQNTLIAGAVLNMVHKERGELSAADIEQLLGTKVLGVIPYDRKVLRAMHRMQPAAALYRRSALARECRKTAAFLCLE